MAGVFCGILGACVGSWVGSSYSSKKFAKEKSDYVQYIALQNELYKQNDQQWRSDYQKLYSAYEELEKETVERDYEEFKAPDTNGDDIITVTEFNTYVRKYLQSFPELSEKDFPKFEDFDLNHDGLVTFDEWQRFLLSQKAKEDAEKGSAVVGSQSTGKTSTGKQSNQAYNDLLNALYDQSNQVDSFNALQKQLNKDQKDKKVSAGSNRKR